MDLHQGPIAHSLPLRAVDMIRQRPGREATAYAMSVKSYKARTEAQQNSDGSDHLHLEGKKLVLFAIQDFLIFESPIILSSVI